MAFARPLQAADENAPVAREARAGPGPGKDGLQAGKQRAALGDIGNLVGPFNKRCNVGKEDAAKKGAAPAQVDRASQQAKAGGVMTRRSAAAAGVVIDAKVLGKLDAAIKPRGAGLRVRDTNVPAATQPEKAEKAADKHAAKERSMSQVLQERSQSAIKGRKPTEPLSPVPDIDSADAGDPLAASEYIGDIFSYYRRVEPHFRVTPDYMSRQADINEKMRAILIDWLVEVHLKFKLMAETLYLTVNLIDRFLELKAVTRKNLQLVGVTAMLIASKYEEIWAPEVKDYVYISDKAYTKEQILHMEKVMLNALRFQLTVPTPFNFLGRFQKASGDLQDAKVVQFSHYLVELSLVNYDMLRFPYSMLAAAALYLAHRVAGKPALPRALQKHAGYTEAALRPCALALAALHAKAPTASLVAVYKKYSHHKFKEVAKLPCSQGTLEPL